MSKEHDQSTRKAMRAGISGENVLRPLDEFSVTSKEVAESNAIPIAVILGDTNHPLHTMTKSLMDRLESGEICLS